MNITSEVYILLGMKEEDKNNPWPGGIKKFENIPYSAVQRISEILGQEFLDEHQNHSPTVQDFLESFKNYKEDTTFDGYIVSPRREDKRVTLEAVTTKRTDEAILMLRNADDFQLLSNDMLYAWYD